MARRTQRAFTLIELLIVIAIIVILIGLAVAVGASVVGGGKKSQTQNTIRALDGLLNDYISSAGEIPPSWISDIHDDGGSTKPAIPVADARNMSTADANADPAGFQIINSSGLLLRQLAQFSAADEVLKGLDAKIVRRAPEFVDPGESHEVPTPFDAWGGQIRYVHPAFHGKLYDPIDNPSNPRNAIRVTDLLGAPPGGHVWAFDTIRRNAVKTGVGGATTKAEDLADSDGGVCPAQRPYFYSAGADGDPSTIEDNVYTTVPNFPS
ncbi:MAG: prepilin-type N-terminal cleavage/methylation domain-containing protein [Phycisphaeraceae bacterium]|nr:prepilin-type N-terminal cleavage/methylation domain-containing protein [Phycisphaeraceae bacterium]